MKVMLTRILLPALLLAFQGLNAQNQDLDSLRAKLSGQPDDTTRVNLLNKISNEMLFTGDVYSSESMAKEALVLAEKLDYKQGLAAAYYSLGRLDSEKGNYPQAMDKFLSSLKAYEELGNKKEIARSLMTIANVYAMMSDNNKALSYYQKAEQIAVGLPGQRMLESLYLNMATVYISQGNHDEGMRCCLKAKNEATKKGDKLGEARVYVSIGRIWEGENNYAEALKSYNDANAIMLQIGDKQGQGEIAFYIGNIYSKQRNFAEALKWHQQAEKLANEIGDMRLSSQVLQAIAHDYESTGKYDAALNYFKRYQAVNDSILNREFSEKLARMEVLFEIEKKESEIEKLKQRMEDKNLSLEGVKSNPVSLLLAGIIIVLALAFIIYLVVSRQTIGELRRQVNTTQQLNNTGGRNFPQS